MNAKDLEELAGRCEAAFPSLASVVEARTMRYIFGNKVHAEPRALSIWRLSA